jgi:uncharacterized protein (DUF488 family)
LERVLKIYTIGHSSQTVEKFIALVINFSIDTVVDVRSRPYSKFAPQFNREALNASLELAGVKYIYMGDLLGAKYLDMDMCFADGRVNFKKVQRSLPFQCGIKRLKTGIEKGYSIALMCAEKDAFKCHRFGLISEYLTRMGFSVFHIAPDNVYTQAEMEKRLLDKYRMKINRIEIALSDDPPEVEELAQAYEMHNLRIAVLEKELEKEDAT